MCHTGIIMQLPLVSIGFIYSFHMQTPAVQTCAATNPVTLPLLLPLWFLLAHGCCCMTASGICDIDVFGRFSKSETFSEVVRCRLRWQNPDLINMISCFNTAILLCHCKCVLFFFLSANEVRPTGSRHLHQIPPACDSVASLQAFRLLFTVQNAAREVNRKVCNGRKDPEWRKCGKNH